MLRDRKIYVPKDKKLKAEIIQLYYDIPVRGQRAVEDNRVGY